MDLCDTPLIDPAAVLSSVDPVGCSLRGPLSTASPFVVMRTLLVGVIALCLCLGMAPAAHAASGTITSTVAAGIVGESVTISGVMPPKKSRLVELQRKSGSKWVKVTTGKTSSAGKFSFTIKIAASTTTYRVYAKKTKIGKKKYLAVTSPSRKITTQAQKGTLSAPTTVQQGASIAFSSTFSPARTSRPVVLQVKKGSTWVEVATGNQTSNGATTFSVEAEAAGTFSYRAVASAFRGAATAATPEKKLTVAAPPADTTAPPVPGNVAVDAGDKTVNLTWGAVSVADLAGYHVYRATSENGPWTKLTTTAVIATTYTATSLTNDTTYWFSVTSIDKADNESAKSQSVKATPATPKPPVPTISSIDPATGPVAGGTLIAITGTNLIGTSKVMIGGKEATNLTVVSSTKATVTTPAHAAGAVDIVLTTPAGSVAKANAYTYGGCDGSPIQVNGTISEDTTWNTDCASVYRIMGTLTVAKDATLTVAAGTVIKSDSGRLVVNGTLDVNGAAGSPVVFTSLKDDAAGGDTNGNGDATSPKSGDWKGLYIGGKAKFTAEYLHVKYAGTGIEGSGADVLEISDSLIADSEYSGIFSVVNGLGANAGGTRVRVTDSTVRKTRFGAGISIIATGTQIPVPVVQNNVVTDAGSTAITIQGDALDGSLLRGNSGAGSKGNTITLSGTLKTNLAVPLGGLPLGVGNSGFHSTLTVDTGAIMTVAAGSVVKSDGGMLHVAGTLDVNGTAGSPVVFTSLKDDAAGGDTNGDGDTFSPKAGDWKGVYIGEKAKFAAEYLHVKYAGTGIESRGADMFEVAHSVIADSEYYGILAAVNRSGANAGGATVKVTDSTVSKTRFSGGINILATGSPRGSGTQIPVPVVQNNVVTDAASTAIWVHGDALDGSLLRGNSGAGSKENAITLSGTLKTDLVVPLGGLPLGLSTNGYNLAVGVGAMMTVAAGSVVKSDGARLVVNGTLDVNGSAGSPVVFTSLKDDAAGGDTNGDSDVSSPKAGDWNGITAGKDATVMLAHTHIKYASTCLSVLSARKVDVNGAMTSCPTGISAGSTVVDARNIQWGGDQPPGIDGNPTVQGPYVTYYPWTGAPIPAPLTSPPATSSTKVDGECADYLFIGVRGSGESPGIGPKVTGIYEGVRTRRADDPLPVGTTFSKIALSYEANPVPIAGTANRTAWQHLSDVANYTPGAWDGAVKLIAQMRDSVEECGDSGQVIILAGYSQGAWVIHAALEYLDEADPGLLQHVGAVGLLADPLRSDDLSIRNLGTADRHDGIGATYVGFAGLTYMNWIQQSVLGNFPEVPNVPMNNFSYPPGLHAKTVELCDRADIVCDTGFALSPPQVLNLGWFVEEGSTVHGGYPETSTKSLGAELRKLLR